MAFDTYGLSEEQYLDCFGKQATLILRAIKKLRETALNEQVNLDSLGSKFTWDVLQEAAYSTDDECRIYQKENDPEVIKQRSIDYVSSPSREEMMDEIKTLHTQVELLTEYVSKLATAVAEGLTKPVD